MTHHTVKLTLKAALVGVLLSGLTACASGAGADKPAPTPEPLTSLDKWKDQIKVDGHADEILLAVHASGVSANQDQAIRALVSRWLDAQAREIVIQAPIGSDQALSGGMAAEVRERLLMVGAPVSKVRVIGYDAAQADAPVKVGFEYFVAEGPKCGNWENLTATRKNETYSNFGCSIAANMAAQIANPEDLIRPRDSTPIDAGRRDVVLGKYRKGETTSTVRDEQAVGTVAKAIN